MGGRGNKLRCKNEKTRLDYGHEVTIRWIGGKTKRNLQMAINNSFLEEKEEKRNTYRFHFFRKPRQSDSETHGSVP